MTRLLTLVVLGIAVFSTICEAESKRIHVTATKGPSVQACYSIR